MNKFHTRLNLTKVTFSKNDIRLGIKVPKYLTKELAYFLGFHVGDGYMKVKKRVHKVDYHLYYGGHQVNENRWYNEFIKPLINHLFKKEVNVAKTNSGVVKIDFRSKAIVSFLHHSCGIPFSPKINLEIPKVFNGTDLATKSMFLRGVADTDFCLTFKKKRKYPVISHSTNDKRLHESLKVILKDIGINVYSYMRSRQRCDKQFVSYEIEIYGIKNLNLWVNKVGFSSYNSITRYNVWKVLGYLPRDTDINKRIKILKERGINPLKRPGSDLNRRPDGLFP